MALLGSDFRRAAYSAVTEEVEVQYSSTRSEILVVILRRGTQDWMFQILSQRPMVMRKVEQSATREAGDNILIVEESSIVSFA